MPQSSACQKQSPRHPNLEAALAAQAKAQHPIVADFLAYYCSIHPHDALPARSRFNPMAIPRLLPFLVLAEVERGAAGEPVRFRVKVAGAEITNALGVSMHGRYMDEIAETGEPTMRFPIESRHTVMQTGLLIYRHGKPRVRFSLDFANIEFVHCPLAEDGVNIDQIVSVFHYEGLDQLRD